MLFKKEGHDRSVLVSNSLEEEKGRNLWFFSADDFSMLSNGTSINLSTTNTAAQLADNPTSYKYWSS